MEKKRKQENKFRLAAAAAAAGFVEVARGTVGIPRLIFEVATRKEPLCDWLETTESDGILGVQAGDRPHGTRMRLRQIQTA